MPLLTNQNEQPLFFLQIYFQARFRRLIAFPNQGNGFEVIVARGFAKIALQPAQ